MSLENDIDAIVNSVDLALYDTMIVNENGETIYRVSVVSNEIKDGKRAGVSLDRYVELTHLISPLLDVSPPVSGEYRLEVGSPGIERKLTTIKHFELSEGENISLTLNDKTKVKALLKKVDGTKLSLESEGETQVVDFSDISKAKTYFEW